MGSSRSDVTCSAARIFTGPSDAQRPDWNSAVRLWEIQPTHLSPDGARTSLAAATFGVFMGLQQVADLLPKGDAAYVRGMTRCSHAVAETAVPVPANWQEHTGEAAQQRD